MGQISTGTEGGHMTKPWDNEAVGVVVFVGGGGGEAGFGNEVSLAP